MSKKHRRKLARQQPTQTKSAAALHNHQESGLLQWSQATLVTSFHALLLMVPLFFWFNTSELFEFNKMVLTYALAIIIILAWVVKMIAAKQFVFRRTPLDIPIVVFLLSQLLATIFSLHPYTSLFGYYSRFHGGLLSIITYVALYYAFVTNIQKKHLPSLFLTTFLAAVLTSVYASLEHFGHSISCWLATKGTSFGVNCWVQDVQNRVFASFGQPNWLAAYLITLIPVGAVFTLINRKQRLRWLYAGSLILMFATLLFTKSRSGILGLGLGLTILFVLLLWILKRQKMLISLIKQRWQLLSVVISICLLMTVLIDAPYTPTLKWNTSQTNQVATDTESMPVVNRLETGGTDSGEIRKIVWSGAIKIWQRYPIFGSGLETFAYSYYLDRPVDHNFVSEWDFLYNKAHNEFLNYLATSGAVGLASYLLLLGWFGIFSLIKIFQPHVPTSDQHMQLLSAGVLAGVAALSLSNFFGFSTVMVTILMYLFMAVMVLINQPIYEWPEDKTSHRGLNLTQILLMSAAGLAGLLSLSATLRYWQADLAYSQGKSAAAAGQPEAAITSLYRAIELNKYEATYYDQLATVFATAAINLAQSEKPEEAQQFATAAEQSSEAVMKLNPHQLNFYKTRARTFITLSQLDPKYLVKAAEAMEIAQKLSSTDPKILYNLGLIEISLQQIDQGLDHLQQAVNLKPDYEVAHYQLAVAYYENNQLEEAAEQLKYILANISPDNQLALDLLASISAQLQLSS